MKIAVIVAFLTCYTLGSARAAPDDPLSLATNLALRIEGDADVAAQQRLLIALRFAKRGKFTEALKLAESIPDYRAGIALAACLPAAPDQVAPLLSRIHKLASVASTRAADELHLRIARYLATSPQHDKQVVEALGRIRDEESRLAAELLVAAQRPGFDQLSFVTRLEKFTAKVPFPSAVEAAELLVQQAVNSWADDEKTAHKDIQQALDLAKRANVPLADFLLQTALALTGMPASELLTEVIAAADKELANIPNAYEFKVPLLVKRARLHFAQKQAKEGKAVLKQTESLALGMNEWSRPSALAWAAVAECHFCNTEGGRHGLDDALHVARQNPNPRMQLLAGIQACFAHDDLSIQVEENLTAKIEALGVAPVSPISAP